MPERLQFDFRFSSGATEIPPTEDAPMCILLMGNFSGHSHVDRSVKERKIMAVDIDNFDTVLSRISPRLSLPDCLQAQITFHRLDDFHPDHLFAELEVFHQLRQVRECLQNPATFAQAAAQMMSIGDVPNASEQPMAPLSTDEQNAMFERLLGKAPAQNPPVRHPSPLDRLLNEIIAPHVIELPDPRQPELISTVDRAGTELMRSLLHHPDYQSLEALWRSAYQMVSCLETGESLQLYLLDIGQADFVQDLLDAGEDLESSAVYQLLVEQGIDRRWSIVVGDYAFAAAHRDLQALAAMSAIAARAGAPFLAMADDSLLGCTSLSQQPHPSAWNDNADFMNTWQSLRESPYAKWLGLALPRILLRLPYGRQTDPLENFDFEELETPTVHEAFLWGNPAFACARMLAQSFLDSGWSMSPDQLLTVGDLPAYTYKENDETLLQACAEWYLSETTGEAILEKGIMPLMSYRNRNSVRLLRFQSVAEPHAGLAGAWR